MGLLCYIQLAFIFKSVLSVYHCHSSQIFFKSNPPPLQGCRNSAALLQCYHNLFNKPTSCFPQLFWYIHIITWYSHLTTEVLKDSASWNFWTLRLAFKLMNFNSTWGRGARSAIKIREIGSKLVLMNNKGPYFILRSLFARFPLIRISNLERLCSIYQWFASTEILCWRRFSMLYCRKWGRNVIWEQYTIGNLEVKAMDWILVELFLD